MWQGLHTLLQSTTIMGCTVFKWDLSLSTFKLIEKQNLYFTRSEVSSVNNSAGGVSWLTRHGRRPSWVLGLQFECPSSGKNAWLTFLTFDLLINNFWFCMLCSLFQCQTFFYSFVYFWGHLTMLSWRCMEIQKKKQWWDSRKHLNFRIPLVERERVVEELAIGSAVVHFCTGH